MVYGSAIDVGSRYHGVDVHGSGPDPSRTVGRALWHRLYAWGTVGSSTDPAGAVGVHTNGRTQVQRGNHGSISNVFLGLHRGPNRAEPRPGGGVLRIIPAWGVCGLGCAVSYVVVRPLAAGCARPGTDAAL